MELVDIVADGRVLTVQERGGCGLSRRNSTLFIAVFMPIRSADNALILARALPTMPARTTVKQCSRGAELIARNQACLYSGLQPSSAKPASTGPAHTARA
jgi:hypothetical protein